VLYETGYAAFNFTFAAFGSGKRARCKTVNSVQKFETEFYDINSKGIKYGKIYEFQSDNVGGWHGYPIPYSDMKDGRSSIVKG